MDLNKKYSQVKISPLPWTERKWVLLSNFFYTIKSQGKPIRLKIPKGFKFDGASVPRLFHIISAPMATDSIIAALVHDWLFHTKQLSLCESNEVFNEVLILCNCWNAKRIIMFLWLKAWSWYVRYFSKEIIFTID